MLQMGATMADVFSDPKDKIRNPASSLSNFKNRLAQIQDISVLGLVKWCIELQTEQRDC